MHENYSDMLRVCGNVNLSWRNFSLFPSKLNHLQLNAKSAAESGNLVELCWSKDMIKKKILPVFVKIFEDEWISEDGNEQTKKFIKKPKDASSLARRNISYEMMQVLTGHSRLNHFQKKLGNSTSTNCDGCNEEETIDHFIFNCKKYDKERQILKQSAMENKILFPFPLAIITTSKSLFDAMSKYIKTTRRLSAPSQTRAISNPNPNQAILL